MVFVLFSSYNSQCTAMEFDTTALFQLLTFSLICLRNVSSKFHLIHAFLWRTHRIPKWSATYEMTIICLISSITIDDHLHETKLIHMYFYFFTYGFWKYGRRYDIVENTSKASVIQSFWLFIMKLRKIQQSYNIQIAK